MYCKKINFFAKGENPYNGLLFVRWDHKEELWKVVIVIWIESANAENIHYVEHEAESFEDVRDAGDFITNFEEKDAEEFLASVNYEEN